MNARGTIAVDDPRRADVRALIARHLAFSREQTPIADVHALDLEALVEPDVTFFSCRGDDGTLLAVGALRMLDAGHAELKSMHTVEAARGHGMGRAMVDHLVDVARSRGVARVSLETGTGPAFAAAQRLYERAGFRPCEAFGTYVNGPHNQCMTLPLGADSSTGG
jgi:putative acetyltransferase